MYRELLNILEATEKSIENEDDEGLKCDFFHSYNALYNAPQSIEPRKTRTSMLQTSTGSRLGSNFATLMSILGGGALMIMCL